MFILISLLRLARCKPWYFHHIYLGNEKQDFVIKLSIRLVAISQIAELCSKNVATSYHST